MRKLISLFLTAVLLLSLCACAGSGRALSDAVQTMSGTVEQAVSDARKEQAGFLSRDYAADGDAHGDIAWADMTYYHYDPTDYYAQIDSLRQAGSDGDAQTACSLYDQLYSEYTVIDTLDSIAYVHYSGHVTDSYWSDERVYCDNLLSEAGDALCDACRELLTGSCAADFRSHVGDDAADYFADYQAMSDRETELTERETELVNQYYEIMDGADNISCTCNGEEWTMSRLNGVGGSRLYSQDYDAYVDTYYAVLHAINDQVGPIYVQLVQIRDEIARLEGYDNYNDYAYDQVYCRDYTPADAQTLCDAVKGDISHAYYSDEIYDSGLWSSYSSVGTDLTSDKLLSLLEQYTPQVDESVYQVWQYMDQYGLYDFGSGDGRMESCYTTSFSLYHAPFIYLYTYGNCYDLDDLTHEFGHYVDAYRNQPENLLTNGGSYDLFEIHSNGLEMLFLNFYDDIYGADAGTASFVTLADQLGSVMDGCIYDEFQRRVYENPSLTLDEINALYADVCEEYGQYEPKDVDYYWMYVSHNYESPLYYISYAVSSLAALQIWDLSQTDYDAAVSTWLKVLDHGAYDEGYTQVLPECGLRLFTEDGALEDICTPVLDRLEALNAAG